VSVRSVATIREVVVVVPAHDEDRLLDRCLRSIAASRVRLAELAPGVSVQVWVVLDGCTDGSEAIAGRHDVELLPLTSRCVGAARAAGVAEGLARCSSPPRSSAPESIWIANTDADSAVPTDWLVEHVRLADCGADVVVGTVRPDPADLSAEQLRSWQKTRIPGRPNGHVHGANLGVRAATYLAAGGFAALSEHEDIDLHARLVAVPSTVVVASDTVDVLTSGRRQGRTAGGYAGYLRRTFL
jgi:glycosyltransferase involved in cell wall biosynthesis